METFQVEETRKERTACVQGRMIQSKYFLGIKTKNYQKEKKVTAGSSLEPAGQTHLDFRQQQA
jgi:hypothetical protein